jgi:hypothetical protein
LSFASDLLPTLRSVRAIPGLLGLRPHAVALVTRAWAGTHTGDGARTSATTAITEDTQSPKVRWLTDEELAVGGISSGAVEVGPITASDDLIELLRGDDISAGDARYLLITGPKHPSGAKYRITEVRSHRAMHYMLRGEPIGDGS